VAGRQRKTARFFSVFALVINTGIWVKELMATRLQQGVQKPGYKKSGCRVQPEIQNG
jgi:hypothetical protein